MAMVDRVSAVGVYPSNSEGTQLKGAKEQILGKDDFLKILITELTHQDPLEPMKDRDMIAQMAQLSQLEQITQFTHSVDNFFKGFEELMNSYKAIQGSSLVGKKVKVEGISTLIKQGEEIDKPSFRIDKDAHVIAKIYNSEGELVKTIDLGFVEKGIHLLPVDDDLEAGTYSVAFEATDNEGNSVAVTPYGWERVEEVQIDNGQVMLLLSNGRIKPVEAVVAYK